MSLARLLELLARTRTTLGTVLDDLPPVYIVRRDVATPWEAKGTVMRRLLERANGEGETIDGLKTYRGRDWALIAPHALEPVIRIWSEAGSLEDARSLAAEYVSIVEELKG